MGNASGLQALKKLQDGNQRFVSGMRSVEPFLGMFRLKELAHKGQRPFAIVLTCSDSRIPTEMIFDQGLGDLFVVRVAGNVVAPSLLASIEFAALNFDTPLILVMGHTECGAIKSAIQNSRNPNPHLSANLKDLIGRISPAVKCSDEAVTTRTNARRSLELILRDSPELASRAADQKLLLVSSVFDLHTGKVDFDTISEELDAFSHHRPVPRLAAEVSHV